MFKNNDNNDIMLKYVYEALIDNQIHPLFSTRYSSKTHIPTRIRTLNEKIDALAEYLEIEFEDIEAQPAKKKAVKKSEKDV